MGAPEGNTNSSRANRLWGDTIRRVFVQDGEKLRQIADKLVELARTGDMAAIKEVGDRLDGKAAQSVAVSGPDGGPMQVEQIVRKIVDPHD